MALAPAHRGYEYQDLLVAARLVDYILGSIEKIQVDTKLVPDDRFDDLTTVDRTGLRNRVQIKHTDNDGQALALSTFTNDGRGLRLDRVMSTMLADRDGPGFDARESVFRIVLRDSHPTDLRLAAVLEPARPDPGPFLHGMYSKRMRFRAGRLWEQRIATAAASREDPHPLAFIHAENPALELNDLEWICERLIVEVAAPAASLDLGSPGPAERLLLNRVRNDVGAGLYPNEDRSALDVAETLIRQARAARQGLPTGAASELLQRARLRTDFGAVARAHPVDSIIEIARTDTVAKLVRKTTAAAGEGKVVLLVGPPGHGKSWICHQLLRNLAERDWLVAEHYCYLGDADGERLPRVRAESVFGSLLGRIAEYDEDLVAHQRPRYAADEHALEAAVAVALEREPHRRVVLVVDGIDHVTRVIRKAPTDDRSFTLSEALAAFSLPPGSSLIVLSQPGNHLQPLKDAGAVTVRIPKLSDRELRQLATQLGVFPPNSSDTPSSADSSPNTDDEASDEFVAALSKRSSGNALYATYLCKEALRTPATVAAPSAAVLSLPPFDRTLRRYYEHLQESLGDQSAWVADVIALLDFPVSRHELKEIRPDAAHRVDQALELLRPVLIERATHAGVRIYHESFARFLRIPFQDNSIARTALLDTIIRWLRGKGIFTDPRAFRHLLPLLSEANRNHEAMEAVSRDFVVRALASGFPASAIIKNLATAVSSAASLGDWPAVIRYAEMSRCVESSQEESFDTAIVAFIDVIASLLGADTVAERLLHDGHPTMPAWSGLEVCAALDALGAVAPWPEYMRAFLREREDDRAIYGEASDRDVSLAWLRGRLRLSSLNGRSSFHSGQPAATSASAENADAYLYRSVDWNAVAASLDDGALPATDVVSCVLDTFGLTALVDLIAKLAHPGTVCLALAESLATGRAPESAGDAVHWAARAIDAGLPVGGISRLFAIGADVECSNGQPVHLARSNLLELTRSVQDSLVCTEPARVAQWLDACALAARRDRVGLNAAEALLQGPGWYTCWLRFAISLVIAEVDPGTKQSESSLAAIRILTGVDNPFAGEPRACDLYPLHDIIDDTIRRAVLLLEDTAWEKAFELLDRVSTVTSTSLQGTQNGPITRNRLLHIAVDTATSSRHRAANKLISEEIDNGGSGRYYSELAEYRLVAARLALKAGDLTEASRQWTASCQLFVAYGFHKDATIYGLLDPLTAMIPLDPARGRAAIAKLQPLCERVTEHTDGKGTRHARSKWWQLLAAADPCAVSLMIHSRLLSSCNDPNWLLHGARSDLWRAWHHRADPVVAAALRLTMEEPLDQNDLQPLRMLTDICDPTGDGSCSLLMVQLLARMDERPSKYCYSNDDELLANDSDVLDSLNTICADTGAPRIAPLPARPVEPSNSDTLDYGHQKLPRFVSLPDSLVIFQPGAVGVAQAIRAWRKRRYDEARPRWSVDRFANVLGYRILEILGGDPAMDVHTALKLIADAGGLDTRQELLKALGEGLERHGHRSAAAIAYTLTWTRSRGSGGWLTFGGETEIESLQRAAKLDPSLALRTIGEEITRVVSQGGGTYGVTQALIYGFVNAGLAASSSIPFEIWDEAFGVIAHRLPRVAKTDDPPEVYMAPDPDDGKDIPGELDAALATAAISGLAHPGREQKRRSLVAMQVLIDQHASSVSSALEKALSSLSDPATLTWLLRVLESAGDRARCILSESRKTLTELAHRPHLTVRALARRLLSGDEVPLAPSTEPDPELRDPGTFGILLTASGAPFDEDTTEIDGLIDAVAGVRISRAEKSLPGLKRAVRKRTDRIRQTDDFRRRMQSQYRAYADSVRKRPADVFLASLEAVEDSMQRAAAGVRGARLMEGEPVADPVALEDELATTLLDDPDLPLAVERTRHPRPAIPPPPRRGHDRWRALRVRLRGASVDVTGVEAARQDSDLIGGTIGIAGTETVPIIVGGPYGGWRLLASLEIRITARPDSNSEEEDIAKRYTVVELRTEGDRRALDVPPISNADLRSWNSSAMSELALSANIGTQPIVGSDSGVSVAGDGRLGLGIPRNLLTPTTWLFATLVHKSSAHFVLDDDAGPALSLITWRTEYDISDYHLAWPRLYGSGLVVRGDAFETLVHMAQGKLVIRDYLAGHSSLCD